MTKYEIKSYEPGFEIEQEKVGFEATKDWDSFHQSKASDLVRIYSQEDFDPETRHYCFHDGKLIGFQVTKILPTGEDGISKASLDFPLVLKGHEEAVDLLYNKAISTLKAKGVEIVEGRAGYYWLGTVEKAKRFGHKLTSSQFCRLALDLTSDISIDSEITYEPFDDERDRQELIEVMKEAYNLTDEQAIANIDAISNNENNTLFQYLVLRINNKIVSRGMVSIGPKPKTLSMRSPVPDLKYLKSYVATVIKLAKKDGYELIESFLVPNDYDRIKEFAEVGFTLSGEINFYVKKL